MTTFQIIIDSILRLLSGLIPLSYEWCARLEEHFLQFVSKVEIDYLVTLVLSLGLLIYFRFDWLGLLSAFFRTITQPSSIKAEQRTLDQEVVIFLTTVSVPSLLAHYWLAPVVAEVEILQSPITYGICFLVSAGLLRFAFRWNRRIRGLNHLRTMDVIPVILLSLLSAHPAFPLALLFWVGLSLSNYHYDAIFKYSMLLLGIRSFAHFLHLSASVSFRGALDAIGVLNGVALLVVCFTFFWMTVENLQKNLSENTFRSFQWLSIFAAVSSFVLYFLKG